MCGTVGLPDDIRPAGPTLATMDGRGPVDVLRRRVEAITSRIGTSFLTSYRYVAIHPTPLGPPRPPQPPGPAAWIAGGPATAGDQAQSCSDTRRPAQSPFRP